MNDHTESSDDASARQFRNVFRIFGAVIVIAALFWLKQYNEPRAQIGKLLIIAGGALYSQLPRFARKERSFKLEKEWRKPRDFLFLFPAGMLTGIGMVLIYPRTLHGWQLLHCLIGLIGLLYGSQLMVGQTKQRQEAQELTAD